MKILLNGLALALLAQAAPALAQADSKAVTYADLDLSAPEGQATLERRLKGAVREVCAGPGVRGLKELHQQRACRRLTWTQARADMDLAIYKRGTVRVVAKR